MSLSLPAWLLPSYLLLCLLLGGSQQDPRPNLVLQLLGVVLIGFALMRPKAEPLTRSAQNLLAIVVGTLGLLLVQLIPLPPQIWTGFPGRESLVASYELLGMRPPWVPMSLAPYLTLETLPLLLPPLAVLIAYMRIRPPHNTACVIAILTGVAAGILLGAAQLAGGQDWYFYQITNSGAVGFFANRNFMGTLLLVSIPFIFALLAESRGRSDSKWAFRFVAVAGLLLIVLGLALNRSMAAIILAGPVVIASSALVKHWGKVALFAIPAALFAGLVTLSFVSDSPIGSELSGADQTSVASRTSIWATTTRAIADSFPVGTGIGSFEPVFATYENPDEVERTYINNAHNDYLQLVLETGIFGVALIAAFLAWWGVLAVRIWRSPSFSAMTRAATIASGAILFHSMVDYPLRTSAIAAIFALCLGIMAQPAEARTGRAQDRFQRARHVKIA